MKKILSVIALTLICAITLTNASVAVKAATDDNRKEKKDSKTVVNQFWVYKGGGLPETSPSSYRAPEPEDEPCEGSNELCGINAPEGTPGQPQISPQLASKINTLDTEGDEVVLRN
ncbi:hypothetical protein GCM10007415_34670 [Parapedobacter pyrenivorans]|uniref:Uncharacterized protein n=1 Tax=Parapedobacter pyrenivorans TaxID=1305674 RepID=A0A917MDS1_9SPHI|nr:hypothetical protein [Parapedobacter pyrenivorans]GGG96535.1 hypothetical protein GCM10007415_34670 [Parapedobacter pyrenivorans]